MESPAKAKTINKYLGPGFRVLASYGHVRDLAERKLKNEEIAGVDIAGGWQARYLVAENKDKKARPGGKGGNRRSPKDILAELKKEADRANRVFLASDPDREGEAIAWHIADELRLDDARTFRITFNEITKSAVQRALAQPSKIHMDRVKAQEARRILDRVVGFPLSKLLQSKVTHGLSAGRVQSVAVRLVVEREYEIEQFQTEEYWKVIALLAPEGQVSNYVPDPARAKLYAKKKPGDQDNDTPAKEELTPDPEREELESEEGDKEAKPEETGKTNKESLGLPEVPSGAFLAELVKWDGQDFKAGNEAAVEGFLTALQTAQFTITKIEQKDRNERPQPPFITSTLQQQANIRLRFSTVKTMQTAQKLYEGVELGSEGSIALITYMRTDSTRVSDDALKAVRQHIDTQHGSHYLPAKPHTYASGKTAQEAHEAIRPTDLVYTPDRVQPYLDADQLRLYTLIYNRFVASQMAPAVFAVTNVEVTADKGTFKAQGKIEKFDGYRKVMPPAGKQEDVILPPLAEQQPLDKLDLVASQHFTQPPPRYNEASLVKAMEKAGIGRPSTYASIINVIQLRKYVEQIQRRFHATPLGKKVTGLLMNHFPRVMDVDFTSQLEEDLDQIETGKTHYEQVLNGFWDPFKMALAEAQEKMENLSGVETGETCPRCGQHPLVKRISRKTGNEFIGCADYKNCKYIQRPEGEPEPEVTEHVCPNCGKPMLKREGKKGTFLGCSGYPECKVIMNIGEDGQPVLAAQPTEHKCPKCGLPMLLRDGRRGKFLACSGYPKCRGALNVDEQGNPVAEVDTGEKCEKCSSAMVIRDGRRGPFLACSGYPKCRNSKPLTPELKEKLKDQLPATTEKKPAAPRIEVHESCPECEAPTMVLRKGPGGRFFLGCTRYPKCKGSRKGTPELLEKLAKEGSPELQEQLRAAGVGS